MEVSEQAIMFYAFIFNNTLGNIKAEAQKCHPEAVSPPPSHQTSDSMCKQDFRHTQRYRNNMLPW